MLVVVYIAFVYDSMVWQDRFCVNKRFEIELRVKCYYFIALVSLFEVQAS